MKKQKIIFLFLYPLILSGCLATTNYYTARTLPAGKMAISPGMDDLIIQSTDKARIIKKPLYFLPSLGLYLGLPYRFETGARWYFTNTYEGILRWQLNPKWFNKFNASANLHYGSFQEAYQYFKYGFTISKPVRQFEPYIGYYQFAWGDNEKIVSVDYNGLINTHRVISLGISVPIRAGHVFPEINYQFSKDQFGSGLLFYSVGFRTKFP